MDIDRLGFTLAHYSAALLLVAAAFIIGRRILFKFSFDSTWEEISFSIGLGLGVLINLVMVLGFLHLLYKWAILAAILACVAVCYPVYTPWPARISSWLADRNTRPGKILSAGFAALLILVILLPILKLPLYPPTGYDATSYHLPLAKYFTQWHAIRLTPYLRFPVFPMNLDMLFTLMLLVYDGVSAQLVNFMLLLVTAIALIGWGKRVQSLRSGVWAAALLLSTPHIFMFAGVAYIDIGLTMFATLAICSFLNWVYSRDDKWLWLSAVLFGLAAGTKYTALFLALLFATLTLYFCIRDRNLKRFWLFCLIIVIFGCPWYIRNFYIAGNPVFPVLSHVFGYSLWTPEDLSRQIAEMRRYGTGRSLSSLLLMPWNLVYHKEYFREFDPLTKTWLFGFPFAVVLGNLRSYTRWLLAISLAFFLFWFYSVQSIRYLDPILPLFGLAVAVSFDMLLSRLPFWKSFWKNPLVAVLIALVVAFPGVRYAWSVVEVREAVPVAAADRLDYLEVGWGVPYRNMQLYLSLNERHGTDYRVYAIDDREMAFYADGVLMGDWFGPARYTSILYTDGDTYRFHDSETMFRVLRHDLNADYLVVNSTPNLQIDLLDLPDDEFFREHFRMIGISGREERVYAVLFEIVD